MASGDQRQRRVVAHLALQPGRHQHEAFGYRRQPMVVKAGQAYVEPPNVKMTGYNRSSTEPLRLVIFYVSDPDTPFLDPIR